MKTYSLAKFAWSLFAFSIISGISVAQSDKNEKGDKKEQKAKIHIRVTENEDGKEKDIEKHYEVGAMTNAERDRFVDKVLDSLGVDKKKKQTISITFEDGENNVFMTKRSRKIIDHRDEREPLTMHWDKDFSYDFDINTDHLRNNMRALEKEIRPKARVFLQDMEDFGRDMGDTWNRNMGKASSVRSLDVYANNPDNGVLNLRFNVPVKGDVNVSVTDTKGREVGSKQIKDFEGEFVGQIELKKNSKGTLFVTVVQNEDGAVKRIVIP